MQHLCACFGESDFVRVLIVLGKGLVFSPAFVCMFFYVNDDMMMLLLIMLSKDLVFFMQHLCVYLLYETLSVLIIWLDGHVMCCFCSVCVHVFLMWVILLVLIMLGAADLVFFCSVCVYVSTWVILLVSIPLGAADLVFSAAFVCMILCA